MSLDLDRFNELDQKINGNDLLSNEEIKEYFARAKIGKRQIRFTLNPTV